MPDDNVNEVVEDTEETVLTKETEEVVPPVEEEAKVVVPEKYEDFNLPEDVEVDPDKVTELTTLAKELGLTQDNAQKLVDFHFKTTKAFADVQQQSWNEVQTNWQNKAKSDTEFGGNKLNESLSFAKQAIDAFGTPELKEALEITGVGNHPEMIRFVVKVGKAIAEDKLHFGGTTTKPVDPAKILFPDQN